jgi:4a-hydroxytetrahydrobiopterin dehydratase
MDLLTQHCTPVAKGTPPIQGEALTPFMSELASRWTVVEDHHLEGRFEYPDFLGALAFTNRAGGAAEAEGHHPEITVGWGEAVVRIWTHTVEGLSVNDFILAARLDTLG